MSTNRPIGKTTQIQMKCKLSLIFGAVLRGESTVKFELTHRNNRNFTALDALVIL